jgi:hypothetical protein
MKNKIFRFFVLAVACVWAAGCEEEPFAKDYDIEFPAASVSSISDETPTVEDEITLEGQNLNTVTSVTGGVVEFSIVSKTDDGTKMVVKVPRSAVQGPLTIMNKYKREFVTVQVMNPQYPESEVTSWPNQIEKGKPFTLKGINLDLLKEVKIKSFNWP